MLADQIVDALNAIFGKQNGHRAVHAKGLVCEGTFRPAPTAASISRAPHLEGAPVPLTVRFSAFPGVTEIPDGDPNTTPHGFAMKFQLPGGASTDIVSHAYNGFPVSNGEEFLAFARALGASGASAPNPSPIEVFAAKHAKTQLFLATPKPIPASFATEPFYGVNAFRFSNREGATCHGRYFIVPLAGVSHLDAADAAARPPRFLFDELVQRLARAPVEFRLMLQLAAPGDPVHDGSITWPVDRPQVELGMISVATPVADSAAAERTLIFDPTRLVDGIELSEDPLPLIRSQAYAVSYARRNP
jgi:catalase